MGEEDWLEAAITDDSLVVELLMRLNQSNASPPPKKTTAALNWSVRQRRSKPIPKLVDSSTKKGELTRASPTTPLSWSGATSVSAGSGGSEGSEESSRPPKFPDDGRSKVLSSVRRSSFCCKNNTHDLFKLTKRPFPSTIFTWILKFFQRLLLGSYVSFVS